MLLRSDVGQRIKTKRLEAKATQLQLAKVACVSVETIRRIEQGRTFPTVESLAEICQCLNVSADYILFGNISRSNGALTADFLINKQAISEKLANDILELFALTSDCKNGTL